MLVEKPGFSRQLPAALYTRDQSRELDRKALEEFDIPGYVLMQRAGAAVFSAIKNEYPGINSLLVVCGGGNNGGDGYIIARLAQEAGLHVTLMALAEPGSLKGDALRAAGDIDGLLEPVSSLAPSDYNNADIIIDAMLGTGLDREVSTIYREVINCINTSSKPVIAVDIPSGINADTGSVMGSAVRASCTVTFIGLKQGLFTGDAPDYCGDILFADLAVPAQVYLQVTPVLRLVTPDLFSEMLGPRKRTAHKGSNGHVLIAGGNYGYLGAACLAGQAALRGGAGLVTIATRPEHARNLALGQAEMMSLALEQPAAIVPGLERCNCVVIGPGLGQDEWAIQLLAHVLQTSLPLVVDADALNLLAQERYRRSNWILTPHPGEAARLLDTDTAEVQADRFAAVRRLQSNFDGVVVLKGAGTLIQGDPATSWLCNRGNPGMASAGMGDVLSGVCAGLLAQGFPLTRAAAAAVYIHASAADLAASAGERGLLASDLLPFIRTLVNPA